MCSFDFDESETDTRQLHLTRDLERKKKRDEVNRENRRREREENRKKICLKQSPKKISSARGKPLNKGREKTHSRARSSRKKLSTTYREKKKPRGKKKSANVRTPKRSSVPSRRSLQRSFSGKRRRPYHTPTLENFKKELKKNRVLSNKTQQKEPQLFGSCKKGRGKNKVQSKHEQPQITNCCCASNDLKERYRKVMEDHHKLKINTRSRNTRML